MCPVIDTFILFWSSAPPYGDAEPAWVRETQWLNFETNFLGNNTIKWKKKTDCGPHCVNEIPSAPCDSFFYFIQLFWRKMVSKYLEIALIFSLTLNSRQAPDRHRARISWVSCGGGSERSRASGRYDWSTTKWREYALAFLARSMIFIGKVITRN